MGVYEREFYAAKLICLKFFFPRDPHSNKNMWRIFFFFWNITNLIGRKKNNFFTTAAATLVSKCSIHLKSQQQKWNFKLWNGSFVVSIGKLEVVEVSLRVRVLKGTKSVVQVFFFSSITANVHWLNQHRIFFSFLRHFCRH